MNAPQPPVALPTEGAGIGAYLTLPADRVKDLRRAVETVLDPLGIVAPIVHAQAAWLSHPLELYELWVKSAADLAALQIHSAAKLSGADIPDVVRPQPDDSRFADPVWTQDRNWDLLKQWYLFLTRAVQDALFTTPGLAPKERRRAAFWWRQYLNAVAPTNFFLTNPVAMRKALETRGESLRKGFEIFMQDAQAKTIRMTGQDGFAVGKDLAVTPGAVVFRNRLLEVIHYAPTAKAVRPMPVVIVTPCINKFYVLDLQPKKSLVRYLLDQGFDVYITSWVNPGAEMRELSFEDYIVDGVGEAVRVARELSGSEKAHAVGYCIGGTLLSTYLAYESRRLPREKVPVESWTLLATLVDFQSPGDIEVFIDEGSVTWLTDSMRARGYLDGAEMAATFRLLRSNPLVWHYLVHGWLYGEAPAPSDVLYWNMDCTRMASRMHEFYLRELYLNNKLVRPDSLTIAGQPIDLATVHVPLYQVGVEDDHITPWRQTFRINSYVTGEKRFVLSSSGHILGIVNPPVEPPRRNYRVGRAHRGESAEAWLAAPSRTPAAGGKTGSPGSHRAAASRARRRRSRARNSRSSPTRPEPTSCRGDMKGLFRPVPKVPPAPSPTAPLILAIDDDLEVRRQLRHHLEAAGYRVATAEDAVEAGYSLSDRHPDLIIADFKMPYMNGNDFVGILRADETIPDIPVLFITSKQNSAELVGRTFGFPLLTKPLDTEDLLATVRALLDRPAAPR